jgi:AraC-like DNA-binding protein
MTDWAAIRTDYETGMSLRQLAAKYSMSKSVIGERKFKEQWDTPQKRTPLSAQNIPSRDINAAVRAVMAINLRATKMTYDAIAQQCGYGSASACRKAVQREMQRIIVTGVEELRLEESAMLDLLHTEMWAMATDKSNAYRTFAVDRVLSISEARRKLFGLDVKADEAAVNQNYVKRIILDTGGTPDAS